ncbi:MAG: DnaJ domain-containing protein [Acidobacteriota bacterium]
MEPRTTDHYETLQVNKSADADTIQRVFRLLAQRYHPDNQETGSEERFREIHEAYLVLSDPEKRAQYDIGYEGFRQERWRFVVEGPPAENDFALEQRYRTLLLEILYSRRRTDVEKPGLSQLDLAQLTGRPREHLEFTIWYLLQKSLVARDDSSNLAITAEGVDSLEQNPAAVTPRLRLAEARVRR